MKTSEHTGYNLVESSFYQDAFLIQPRAKAYLQVHRVKLQSHKQNTRQEKGRLGGRENLTINTLQDVCDKKTPWNGK